MPVFLILQKLHWFNTYDALIVPGLAGAFGMFLLRQFFFTIPRELEEPACIVGCGRAGIYWRIILPLSKPALATLAAFSFLGGWNDFLLPLDCHQRDRDAHPACRADHLSEAIQYAVWSGDGNGGAGDAARAGDVSAVPAPHYTWRSTDRAKGIIALCRFVAD